MMNPQHVATRRGLRDNAEGLATSANDALPAAPAAIKFLPWDWDPSLGLDGYPCGLPVAAEAAIEFAEHVLEMEAEIRGWDWASRIQHRVDSLVHYLPPSAPPPVQELATLMIRVAA